MIEELKKTMMHVFHQLDVDQDLLDHYIPLAEQAEASAKELAAAKAELATHQRKRALDDIIASTKQDTSWVEIFIELIFGYFHDDQEAYEEFREHKERYFSGKPNFGPMDWKIQEMLDLACGTDYAKRDKAAYFARKKAQEEEMLSKTKHKLNLENLPKGRS